MMILNLNYEKINWESVAILISENLEYRYFILINGNKDANNQLQEQISEPNQNLGGYLNINYRLNDKNSFALTYNPRAKKI